MDSCTQYADFTHRQTPCRVLPKNTGHSDFGGDTTRYALTISPLTEIPAPFLSHQHHAGSSKHDAPCASVDGCCSRYSRSSRGSRGLDSSFSSFW